MDGSPYHHPKSYPASSLTSMGPDTEPLPVVVVGAGPVGMAVALGLAQRGIRVTVLEAADAVSFGSRAICISRHSLEVAHRLGFGEVVEATALPWLGGRSYFREAEVLSFRMPMAEHDVRAPMVNIGQSELEQIMVDRILADPLVTLAWRAEVVGFHDDGSVVEVGVSTAEGLRTLRASWVVATDGGRSRMRELAGLDLEGTSYEGRYVIADIHWPSDLPVERRVWFDPPTNPGSTVLMHRQPHDIWRVDYQIDPRADVDAELQEGRIRERIAQHLDWLGNDVPWTLEWHSLYMAHARALDNFVHGRVIFAGDAAHLVPIFGVRGLNSGLEDAETLAWMLAAVIDDRAEPALLQAYAVERHSAWEQNVNNAAKSTRIMTPGTQGYVDTREAILRLSAAYPALAGGRRGRVHDYPERPARQRLQPPGLRFRRQHVCRDHRRRRAPGQGVGAGADSARAGQRHRHATRPPDDRRRAATVGSRCTRRRGLRRAPGGAAAGPAGRPDRSRPRDRIDPVRPGSRRRADGL